MTRKLIAFACIALLIALAGCGSQSTPTSIPEPTAAPETSQAIVLAEVGDEPSETIEAFQPMADYLAAQLQEQGISVGEVKVAPDLETMAEWIETGEVDIFFDSPYPALIVSDETGAQPILRRWKDGVSEYSTIFFARADSEVESLESMPGHTIAFEESFSTSGYMLPLAHMIEVGLQPVEIAEPGDEVGDDEVGFVFSGDDENTIQWVVSNRVSVGVVDSNTYSHIPEETREQLRIVAETEALPRHLVVVRPGMEPELVDAIIAVLTAMDESEDGLAVLESFEETAQFDEFPGGIAAALARMRELYELVTRE